VQRRNGRLALGVFALGYPNGRAKGHYAGMRQPKARLAGDCPTCRNTIRLFRRPSGIPYGSAWSGEIRGRFGGLQASWQSPDGLLPKSHIPPRALAARPQNTVCMEKEIPRSTAFGRTDACRTVWFIGRLRQKPVGIPYGHY